MLGETDVALVVIGKRWFGAGRGRRRIDDPADPVRVEVETALRSGVSVVPVLVEGGAIPKLEQLPDSLQNLVYRNGLEVNSGRDFDQHIERLIRNINPILTGVEQRRAAAQRTEEERQYAEETRRKAEEERVAEETRRKAEEERLAEETRRKRRDGFRAKQPWVSASARYSPRNFVLFLPSPSSFWPDLAGSCGITMSDIHR